MNNIFYDKMDLRLFYFDVTICLSAVHLVNLIFFFFWYTILKALLCVLLILLFRPLFWHIQNKQQKLNCDVEWDLLLCCDKYCETLDKSYSFCSFQHSVLICSSNVKPLLMENPNNLLQLLLLMTHPCLLKCVDTVIRKNGILMITKWHFEAFALKLLYSNKLKTSS